MSSDDTSSGPQAPPFRVRFSGQTFRVKDESSLRRLVETGKVPAGAVVQRPGQTAWLTLDQALAPAAPAAEAGVDPWNAWADIDDEPAPGPTPAPTPAHKPASGRPVPQLAPKPPPAPPPPEAIPVAFEPPSRAEDVSDDDSDEAAELPAMAAEPIPSRPPPKASLSTRGQVIPFPGPRPGRRDTDGPHALAPEPLPFPERPPPSPPPPPMMDLGRVDEVFPVRRRPVESKDPARTNWWRIGFVAFLGIAVLSLARMYVSTVAEADFGPANRVLPPGLATPATPPPPGVEAVASTPPRPPVEVDIEAAYREVEAQLRASMMAGTQPTATAAELETALFLELNRVRLSVIRVDVSVLATRDDLPEAPPQSVELRLLLRSDGSELDREIAAAAMVIGKYVQAESLTVPVFEIAFDGLADGKALRTRVDADLARQLYAGHLRMGAFLQAQTR